MLWSQGKKPRNLTAQSSNALLLYILEVDSPALLDDVYREFHHQT
jgi:hypothetical protein